jgi:hypothetical protein
MSEGVHWGARRRGGAALRLAAAAALSVSAAGSSAEENRFAALLHAAGVELTGVDWRTEPAGSELSAAAASQLDQTLVRLQQFPDRVTRAWETPFAALDDVRRDAGALTRLAGVVEQVERFSAPVAGRAPEAPTEFFRCRVRAGDRLANVWAPHVPAAWLRDPAGAEPPQTALRGAVLGGPAEPSAEPWTLVTDWMQWRSPRGLAAGAAWLSAQGVDGALWGEIRQRRGFVAPQESREGDAFYASLAVLAAASPADVTELARQNLAESLPLWEAEAQAARRRAEGGDGSGEVAEGSATDHGPNDGARQAALAAEKVRAARAGRTSVAPLFLQPEASVGQWVLIEGVARRAVRAMVPPERRAAAGADLERPADAVPASYFELEVFTNDSQNLPIVCCAARLPAGFPTGDRIREPVRFAGVFFKNWRYLRRNATPTEGARSAPRSAAPIVLGAMPQRVTPSPSGGGPAGWLGGAAVLGLLAAVWGWHAWSTRRDRLARQQRTEYDAPFVLPPDLETRRRAAEPRVRIENDIPDSPGGQGPSP